MEAQLKPHLPKLCRRLNPQRLYNSLVGILPDSDAEIIDKKLTKGTDQTDSTINMYIYRVLKKHTDTEHVFYFLAAVQEQFDLHSLGITFMTPRQEEMSSQPMAPQQSYPAKMVPYPAHLMYPDPHVPSFPQKSFTSPSFHPFEGSHTPFSLDSGREIRPLKPPVPLDSNSLYPPVFHSSIRATQSMGQQPGVTMQDLVDNIASKKHSASLPQYPYQKHTGQSGQINGGSDAVSSLGLSPNRADGQSNAVSASSGTHPVPQPITADNRPNNAIQSGTYVPNILASVEDNVDSGLASTDGFKSGPHSSAQTGRPLDCPSSLPVGGKGNPTNLSFNGSSDVNFQTDGDLSAEDVQPEQPETVMEDDDSGAERGPDPQHTLPPRSALSGVQPTAPTLIFNIAKIKMSGQGNHLDLGGNKSAKTVFNSAKRREGTTQVTHHDEHSASLPHIALPPHQVEQFLEAMLNAEPQVHNQCSIAQELGNITQTQDENPVGIMDLPEYSQASEHASAHVSGYTVHNQTHPKLEYQQNQAGSSELLEHSDTTQQPSSHLPVSSPLHQTDPKIGFEVGNSSTERMEPASAPDLSSCYLSDYTVHQNTQQKMKRQNPTKPNYTKFRRDNETYNRQIQQKDRMGARMNTRNSGQGYPSPRGAPSPRENRNDKDESRMTGIPLTVAMPGGPAPLLGPEELRRMEDQRAESIEIPAHITLTPEASSGSEQ